MSAREQADPQSAPSANTAPDETYVAIVGTYRGTGTPMFIEYLTPDYTLADRIDYWQVNHYRDAHAARQTTHYVRLTAEQAEQERSQG